MRLKLTAFLLVLISIFNLSGCNNNYYPSGQNILIHSFSPVEDTSFSSGNMVVLSVMGKFSDLSVTAYFDGKVVQLNREASESEETDEKSFCYSGLLTMPSVKKKKTYKPIKFVCKKGETTETYYSGKITVLPADNSKIGSSDVGEAYIAEVINAPSETFNGNTIDDLSKPCYSSLPVGTVDYCSSSSIINSRIEKNYRLLNFGRRVYDNGNIKIYKGKLPENNVLSVDKTDTTDKYTVLSFFCDFKAPFTLELKGQEYKKPEANNWNIHEQNFTYVEIKFMYCNTMYGDVSFDKDNPLFSHTEKFMENNCYVLRLYLKKAGNFYGYKAEYDENDCLTFKFLQPTRIYSADNEYGYILSGKTIIIDAGHGGKDSGAVSDGVYESHTNLALANLIKNELLSIGANVIMTRTDDSYMTAAERLDVIYNAEPDLVISVHRNSGSANGYGSYYFNPFSFRAATHILDATVKSKTYRSNSGVLWHYFFLNRTNVCPSVLTENGYINDSKDLKNMQNADHQVTCAKATVKGIVGYFISQHA